MTLTSRLRLSTWYAVGVGSIVAIPFLTVVLVDSGLSQSAAAAAMLVLPFGQLIGGPLWSWVADRTASPHTVLRLTTAACALAGLTWLMNPSPTILVLTVSLYALARGPVHPLADAITLASLGADRRSYGGIRAVGSMAYVAAVVTTGALRDTWPRASLIVGGVLLVATAVATWWLPRPAIQVSPPDWLRLRGLLLHPVLAPLMGVCLLHGITITTYDSLFALHIANHELPSWVAGAGFGVGVAVEVVMLLVGRRLLDLMGPGRLLLVGVAAGIPRWLITGMTTSVPLLVGTQGMHGLTFGAFWVAGVALFSERAPEGLQGSTQALLPAATFGAGYLASMTLASMTLQRFDTTVLFTSMAAISTLATAGVLLLLRSRDEAV